MANSSDDHKPGSAIDDALDDITSRFPQLEVTDNDDKHNSHEANHAQSSYSYRYSQGRVFPQTRNNSNYDDPSVPIRVGPRKAKNGKARNKNNAINYNNSGLIEIRRQIAMTAWTPQGSQFLQTVLSKNQNTNYDPSVPVRVGPRKAKNGKARNNNNAINYNNSRLIEIRRQIAMTAWTPQGSQFLQMVLSKNQKYSDLIFEGVFEYMFDILVHEYATNVFAKLVEVCNNHQLQLIVKKLSSMKRELFVEAGCDRFGANSIKRLIKVLEESPLVLAITSLLARDFTTLMKNRISSYVIIKCFETLGVKPNMPLIEATFRGCIDLATDENGCLALNEIMTYFKQPYKDSLLQVISSQARYLSQDPSGNYVVQEVLELYHPYFTVEIYNLLRGDIVRLSTIKSSSRVIEKCLLTEEGVNMILEEFINSDKLLKVACDQNGNYVIQKALDMAEGTFYYEAFVEKLYNYRHLLQLTIYGKHVYHKLMNI